MSSALSANGSICAIKTCPDSKLMLLSVDCLIIYREICKICKYEIKDTYYQCTDLEVIIIVIIITMYIKMI